LPFELTYNSTPKSPRHQVFFYYLKSVLICGIRGYNFTQTAPFSTFVNVRKSLLPVLSMPVVSLSNRRRNLGNLWLIFLVA
jgi:hypothetical protein